MTLRFYPTQLAAAGSFITLMLCLTFSTSAFANSCDEESDPSQMVAGSGASCEVQSTTTNNVTSYSCKNNNCKKKCILKVITESEGDSTPVVVDRICLCKSSTGTPATMEDTNNEAADSAASW